MSSHQPHIQASSSPILRIRMWSIKIANCRSIKHFFNLFLFYILGSNNNQDNAGEGQARRKNLFIVFFLNYQDIIPVALVIKIVDILSIDCLILLTLRYFS